MAAETYDSSVNKYLNTYTTFSGADIVATFGGIEKVHYQELLSQ